MKQIDNTADDLSAYAGWLARPWRYSATHRELVLRFSLSNDEVFLVLALCERFSLKRSWKVVAPRCSLVPEGVLFQDDGIEVLCQHVRLSKNLSSTVSG